MAPANGERRDHGQTAGTPMVPLHSDALVSRRRAIDPPHCGCTPCIIGETVPLDEALPKEVAQMFRGGIANCTGADFEIIVKRSGWNAYAPCAIEVEIYCAEAARSWDVTQWGAKILKVVARETKQSKYPAALRRGKK